MRLSSGTHNVTRGRSTIVAASALVITLLFLSLTVSTNSNILFESKLAFAQIQEGGAGTTNTTAITNDTTGNITEPDLLTYVDRANGIKIQYPASWRISLLSYPGLVAFYAPLESLYDTLPALVSISMTQYRNNISLSEYSNLTLTTVSQLNDALNQSNQTVNIKSAGPIFISGYPAYRVILSIASNVNNPLGLEVMQAWTVVENRVYIISYTSEPSKFIGYLSDAESILRSFVISNTT